MMGWLRRLFGPRVPALRFPRSGEYSERIVGEASYQAAIERLAGGSPEDGSSCDIPVTAELIWEDDNPADDEAIQVQVQGMVVGRSLLYPAEGSVETAVDTAVGLL